MILLLFTGETGLRILYFDWNEFTGPDCREAMRALGHTVGIWKHLWNCRAVDPEFTDKTERALLCPEAAGEDGMSYDLPRDETPQWDLVFSFNYYPAISEVCARHDVPYVSWVFDSPYLPLTSDTIRNEVNIVYLFDRALCTRMRRQGIGTVRHQPLAVNARRMSRMRRSCAASGSRYVHDISFVGGLYADKNNFYNTIAEDLPLFLRGYLEDVLHLQTGIYGRDLIGDPEVVTDEMLAALHRHIRFDVPEVYGIDYDELLRDMLRTQATEMDRFSLLEVMGRRYPGRVDLYTRYDSPPLPGVNDLGYASYLEKMPQVFRMSRINLNITLRTIRTGIPLRALDILAAGGFLLSTAQEELGEYFDNGKDMVAAANPEEMLLLADWFLAHDEAREEIARRGCEKACALFDYERVLAGTILRI